MTDWHKVGNKWYFFDRQSINEKEITNHMHRETNGLFEIIDKALQLARSQWLQRRTQSVR